MLSSCPAYTLKMSTVRKESAWRVQNVIMPHFRLPSVGWLCHFRYSWQCVPRQGYHRPAAIGRVYEVRPWDYTGYKSNTDVCTMRSNYTMMTSSNGNIFRVTGPFCEGNPPVTGWFPSQRPVTRGFGLLFNLRLNRRLRKQSRRRWF